MRVLTRTELELAAISVTLLDHLDSCEVCADEGVRWCPEFVDLQAALRHERIRLLERD